MKNIIVFYRKTILVAFLFGAFTQWVFAQSDVAKPWSHSVSLGANVNQLYGDLKDANRQYAADQSTIWGQSGSYSTHWRVGMVLNGSVTRWLFKPFGISAGCTIATYGTKESLTISYNPTYMDYVRKEESVTNQMLYASPKLALAGKWRNFGIEGGIAANIFLAGKSTWENDLEKTDGTHQTEVREGRFDIQDQPIYADEEAVGGVVDYTYLNPANHGVNPVWLSAFAGASYTLRKDRPSPFLAFNWQFGLQEAVRSRTPYFSLRNSIQSPFQEDINQGSKFKSLSVAVGYRF